MFSRIVSVPPAIFRSNPRLKHVNMSGNFLITLEIQVSWRVRVAG
jgi:hypothetical protein